jgi:hypothetical protein
MLLCPDNFSGWVTILGQRPGAPAAQQSGDHYVFRIRRPAEFRTSSELRTDRRGARFVAANGASIATQGGSRRIWGWFAEANCASYQTFFVGTRAQYRASLEPPVRKTLERHDCSKLLPSRSEW